MCQNFEDCKKYREINTEIQEYEETIKKVSKKKKNQKQAPALDHS